MKILFILEYYRPHVGGVETLFENLIKGLIEKGHKIKVLTTRFDPSLSEYEKVNEKFEIYRVGHSRYDFMIYCLRTGIKLAKESDIIHTTTYNGAIPSSIIGKLTGKKVVITVHEIFGMLWYKFFGWKGVFFKLFEALIFKFHFDKYICVSHYTKNNLRVHFGVPDHKLITIYNGIDYEIWNTKNIDHDKVEKIKEDYNLTQNFVGLYFGRAGISKGLRYYIQAIPEIIKHIPDFRAMLIVSESQNNMATFERKLIKELGIEEHAIIRIPGVKYDDLRNYISACDFAIAPSLTEGFGFSAVETCCVGQNLIVCNVGSLTEVVYGKVNFVEPSSSQDISKAVINFKNRKFTHIPEKTFKWEDNIHETLKVYDEIMK